MVGVGGHRNEDLLALVSFHEASMLYWSLDLGGQSPLVLSVHTSKRSIAIGSVLQNVDFHELVGLLRAFAPHVGDIVRHVLLHELHLLR